MDLSFQNGAWKAVKLALARPPHVFSKSAGIILCATGLAKIVSATGTARALDVADPFLGLHLRYVMLFSGLIELLISFFCLFTPRYRLCLDAVAWLATNCLVYRLGLWLIGWHRPCNCMGSLTEVLRISPVTADWVMRVLLAYLLCGSYLFLYLDWKSSFSRWRNTAPADGLQ
jgi:hypothetical protein